MTVMPHLLHHSDGNSIADFNLSLLKAACATSYTNDVIIIVSLGDYNDRRLIAMTTIIV